MVSNILTKHLIPSDQFIFGCADLHGLLNRKFKGFNYGISIGKRLDDNIVNAIKQGPTLEYYNHYKSINVELAQLTMKIHNDLLKAGIVSLPVEPTISSGYEKHDKKYLKTLSVDLSHKMVATKAGLGWIGKTDLFISRTFGPRLRLVSILLKENPGITSTPVNESECGNCTICVEKCPAGAANGKLWNTETKREDFFDPHKCREKCGELAIQRLNVDVRICGLCVSVCPFGKRQIQKTLH